MKLIQDAFLDIFENACDSNCHLSQGDIIKSAEEFTIFGKRQGVVGYLVLSNSCDLINNKLSAVLLAPIYSFNKWYNPRSKKNLENIAKDLHKEANYAMKTTFFIPPLGVFENSPSIAFVDDIKSVPIIKDVFKWQEVPGNDEKNLKSFLRGRFGLRWMMDADIAKIDNDATILISNNGEEVLLSFNDSKTNLVMTHNSSKIADFEVRKEDGELNISFNNEKFLLNYRVNSLKPPWKEKLGHMVGELFNRVSTDTPEIDRIKGWTKNFVENSNFVSENKKS